MNDLKSLETEKIQKLIKVYSVPAIIAMLVNAIYNIVDRMFIGKIVGEDALAGLTIAFPLTTILFAVATLIGIGASNLVSNKLGEKDIDSASKIFCTAILYGVISTAFLCSLAFIFRYKILILLGGNSPETLKIIHYAEEYLNIILLGFVFLLMSFILSNMVRAEGKPLLTMRSMITACLTNVVFDFIFIYIFKLGVSGAAYATILGQFVGLVIIADFYIRKNSVLKFKKEYFKLDLKIIKGINKIGFSSFIINSGNAVSLIFINNIAIKYGGSGAITAMNIAFSIQTLVFMPIFGLRQGMQTIIGYNYGARNIKRVYETLFYGMKISFIFSLTCFALIQIFPQAFALFFLKSDSEILSLAVVTLRIFFMFLPLYFIQFLGLSLFQATNRGNIANIVTIVKQIAIIPLLFIAPMFLGINGVFLSIISCDLLVIIFVFIILVREYRIDMKSFNNKAI